MLDNSLENLPKQIQELALQAESGKVSPQEFCKELYSSGIRSQAARMHYLRKVFGISSAKAKQVVIETDQPI